ncbi:MAG: DUF3243 domain-containing protein [Thermoactinomyces sp.]
MSVLNNFQEWKNFLAERVDQAKNMGMDQNTISDLAYHLGDYLSKDIDPQNEQERLLKDLWSVADPNEQRVMAGLMVKLVDDGKK